MTRDRLKMKKGEKNIMISWQCEWAGDIYPRSHMPVNIH